MAKWAPHDLLTVLSWLKPDGNYKVVWRCARQIHDEVFYAKATNCLPCFWRQITSRTHVTTETFLTLEQLQAPEQFKDFLERVVYWAQRGVVYINSVELMSPDWSCGYCATRKPKIAIANRKRNERSWRRNPAT